MIGIVIVNYNTYEKTIKCIECIKKFTSLPYKIYIVDNCSKDGSGEKLIKQYRNISDIEVILSKRNRGYSAGNNIGIFRAQKDNIEKIVILNSDVFFQNDCIGIMYKKMQETKCAVIGPKLYDLYKCNIQLIRKCYDFKKCFFDRKPFLYFKFINDNLEVNYKIDDWDKPLEFTGMVAGCCFMIDMKIFEEIGFFDEKVFLYAEEYIISKKLKNLNYKTYYEPNAIAIHEHAASTKKEGNAFINYHRYLSAIYYLVKYCNINMIQKILIFLQMQFNYGARAIFYKDYRKRYILFSKQLFKLLFIKDYKFEQIK